jgi:hypothetical protein
LPRKQSQKRKRKRSPEEPGTFLLEIEVHPSFGIKPRQLVQLSALMITVYGFLLLLYARFGGMNLFDFFVLILYTNIWFFYITYFMDLSLLILWSRSLLPEWLRKYLWYPLTALGWIGIVMGFWNVDFAMEKYHPEISLEPIFAISNFTYTYWDLYSAWWSWVSIGVVLCIVGLFNLTERGMERTKRWRLMILGGLVMTLIGFYIVNTVVNLPPTRPGAIVWVGHDPFGHQAFDLDALVFIRWNISLSLLGAITALIASYLAGHER